MRHDQLPQVLQSLHVLIVDLVLPTPNELPAIDIHQG
jgi:hypothetical protein